MLIRPFMPAEAASYRILRLNCLRENPTAFGTSPEEEESRTLAEVRRSLAADDDTACILGAFQGDTPIGMMVIRREQKQKSRHKASLNSVYVTSEWRGKGVGRELLAAALDRARAMQGLEQLVLGVSSDNVSAIRLYESVGFVLYGHEPRALKWEGGYMDLLQMILLLPTVEGCDG